ncbi:hypothetical protein ACSNOI_11080, partial [Actinomadura kijaniata]
ATPAPLREPWPLPVLGRAPIAAAPPGAGTGPGAAWPGRGQIEINSLERDASGYATLVWTVDNADPDTALDPSFMSDPNGVYRGSSTSAVALTAGDRRIRAVRDATGRTVGAPDFDSYGPARHFTVDGGDTQPFWAMFKIPADVTSVTVEIPGYRPVPNVPVG